MPGVCGQGEKGRDEREGQVMKGFGRKTNDSEPHSGINRKPPPDLILEKSFVFFFNILRFWLRRVSQNVGHGPTLL